MKIYLVGGAVRDRLLGRPVKERDWVVVGSSAEEMLKLGYQQVGKDFPVFLHPKTHEEYALARTERKTAPGYTGFVVHATPDISLEQDLARRDLTINSMAIAEDQIDAEPPEIIDPFNGQEDLQNGLLRHVSPAFREDPVRILRIARFAARYGHWGFKVAHTTNKLMKEMTRAGEVDALVPERVWSEMEKALGEEQPQRFITVLRGCGALARIFPEIDALFGVPQPEQHHGEIDTGVHCLMVLQQAVKLTADKMVRFAALTHDLGKAETPEAMLPQHIGHEQRSVERVKQMCSRLRAPKAYLELAVITARYHTLCHRAQELKATTLLKTLESVDAFRRPERFTQFLLACEADARGRKGKENQQYPQADIFRHAYAACLSIDNQQLLNEGYRGERFAQELYQRRIAAIKAQQASETNSSE